MLKIKSYGEEYQIMLRKANYVSNGNLAIQMLCVEDGDYEPYASLTVNLDVTLSNDMAYVDVNNLGHSIMRWIVENGLGEPLGCSRNSGFVTYPLFRFNLLEVSKHSVD